MEDTVKGATLRKIGESLGRFADMRETAKEPRDRVVVQAGAGMIKVVAGAYYGTIIATVHATTEQWRAVVSARELLVALKAAKTKGDYKFTNLNRGFEVGCTLVGDGEVDLLRVSKSLPRVMLPPDLTSQSQGSIPVKADDLAELGKIMPAVADYSGYPVTVAGRIYTKTDKVRFAATNGIRFASRDLRGAYDIFGVIYAEWLEAARGIGDAVMEFWTDEKVTLDNDRYRVIGAYRMLTTSGPLDFAQNKLESVQYKAVIDRSSVIKSIKEHQKLDKHLRVALQYTDNGIKVVPFSESSGWYARGENLLKVLSAISTKQVGIGLRRGPTQPINVRIPEWTIEVAPVTPGA